MAVSRRIDGRGCPTCDTIVTDRPIKGSVGLGGGNNADDVRTIQQFLNALSPAEGGPALVLAEDGICGPKTQGAINKYQTRVLGWADGRIDVHGGTIKALTGYICSSVTVAPGKLGQPENGVPAANSPNTGPPPPSTSGVLDVAMAHAYLNEMEPRLHSLRWKLVHLSPATMALLNKHFATKKDTVTTSDAGHVNTVLGGIHHYMARFNAFGIKPFDNVILHDPSADAEPIAYTVRGGDKMSTSQIQIYDVKIKNKSSPGKFIWTKVKSPGQSIWLTLKFGGQVPHEKRWTLLHEFAHFVGPRDGFPTKIHDYAYSWEANFLTIPKFQKLHNAESLSLFYLEWCIGTQAICTIPSLSSHVGHFNASPRVVRPAGEIVM